MFNHHSAVLWSGKCPAENATAVRYSGYRPFKRNLSQLKLFLNDSFRTSDTPELMIFLFLLVMSFALH